MERKERYFLTRITGNLDLRLREAHAGIAAAPTNLNQACQSRIRRFVDVALDKTVSFVHYVVQ